MKRAVPLAIALALALVGFSLPRVPALRIAALEAERVLAPREVSSSGPDGVDGKSLAAHALAGPAARPGPPDAYGRPTLLFKLHGVSFRGPPEPGVDALLLHGVARTSIARGIRAEARRQGVALTVVGEDFPGEDTQGGAVFLVERDEGVLAIDYEIDDTPGTEVRVEQAFEPAPWRRFSKSSLALAGAALCLLPLPWVLGARAAGRTAEV